MLLNGFSKIAIYLSIGKHEIKSSFGHFVHLFRVLLFLSLFLNPRATDRENINKTKHTFIDIPTVCSEH
jgi:hypothetical protein